MNWKILHEQPRCNENNRAATAIQSNRLYNRTGFGVQLKSREFLVPASSWVLADSDWELVILIYQVFFTM
jgi:hypothetical protein